MVMRGDAGIAISFDREKMPRQLRRPSRGRAIIRLFAVVYHDRYSRSLVVVVIEEHGIGADPPIFQIYTPVCTIQSGRDRDRFRVSLTSLLGR